MPKHILLTAYIFFLVAATAAGQEDPTPASLVNFLSATNQIFITISDMSVDELIWHVQKGLVDTNRFAQAQASVEARPEKQDPSGNWGPPSEGFRLSLRLATNEFEEGHPIIAAILVRNVTKRDLVFRVGTTDLDFQFLVRDSAGHLVEADPFGPRLSDPKAFPIYPRTQRRYEIRLDSHFKLEPGDYSVAVTTIVSKLSERAPAQITSGTAHFKIIAPVTSTGTNTAPSGH